MVQSTGAGGLIVIDPLSKVFVHSFESHRFFDGLNRQPDKETSREHDSSLFRTLSSRAILMSRPGDLVVVDEEPDPEWIQFLSLIGIETGATVTPQEPGETLAQRVLRDDNLVAKIAGTRGILEPYMGGDEIQALATILQLELNAPPSTLLDRVNLKSKLFDILSECELPVIQTLVKRRSCVHDAVRSLLNDSGPVMVRSDLSIGGLGVWKIENLSDLDIFSAELRASSENRLFIVQPLHDVTNSPNVQFDIQSSTPELIGVSAQHMTQSFAFGGNDFPSPVANNPVLLDQSKRVARWLNSNGYRGIVGIDFILTANNEVFIVEINPRVNTSTFPLYLTKRLGRAAFRLITGIECEGVNGFNHLVEVVGKDLLYCSNRRKGLVPLMVPDNERPILDAMVFADDLQTVNKIFDALNHRVKSGIFLKGGVL
jgi:hypothetical protein